MPDVLMHLVGHVEGSSANNDGDEPAPDDDYIVGGTGVVKALQYVLGEKANDLRRSSVPSTPISGAMTPREGRPGSSAGLPPTAEQRGKAKKMSKNLLESARKIRLRLQPALVKEATAGDELAYRRLLFLDQTLQNMIQRFEEEYPETRIGPPSSPRPAPSIASSRTDHGHPQTELSLDTQATADLTNHVSDDEDLDDETRAVQSGLKRHGSEVNLASRALALEEGRLHRLGQHLRREVLDSPTSSSFPAHHQLTTASGSSSQQQVAEDTEARRIKALGDKLDAISGAELKGIVESEGWERVLRKVGGNYDDLRKLQELDPAGWEQFRESQMKARINLRREGGRGDLRGLAREG